FNTNITARYCKVRFEQFTANTCLYQFSIAVPNSDIGHSAMIRHPAAAISITHKDVDDLAVAQRLLLEPIQKGKGKSITTDGPANSKTPQRLSVAAFGAPLLVGNEDKPRDGFGIARQRRQN
ncbi:hypothetical protein GGI22_007433, partial [Coemansia erecta]